MSELSIKMKELRGTMSAEDLADKAKLSRESIYRLERGGSVKLHTLRQLASALDLPHDEWIELLASWLRSEAGLESQFLWIEPKQQTTTAAKLREYGEDQVAKAMVFFRQLNAQERAEIIKAMQRTEVRACLPAINRVWEKFDSPKPKS